MNSSSGMNDSSSVSSSSGVNSDSSGMSGSSGVSSDSSGVSSNSSGMNDSSGMSGSSGVSSDSSGVSGVYSNVSSSGSSCMNNDNSSNEVKQQQWMKEIKMLHDRCGHAPYRKLRDMIKNGSVTGVSDELRKESVLRMIIETMKEDVCDVCVIGKMKRLPMTGTIDHHAEQTMDLWVADIMGPVGVKTFTGMRYVLVMMDVYSHKMFAVLMKRKRDAKNEIIIIMKREQTQQERRVKVFHSDGGGEFVNTELKQFFEQNGTTHTTTTPYTPQHNAIIERANRTICEMARSIMYHSHACTQLWGAAVITSIYLLNRTPCTWTGRNTNTQ